MVGNALLRYSNKTVTLIMHSPKYSNRTVIKKQLSYNQITRFNQSQVFQEIELQHPAYGSARACDSSATFKTFKTTSRQFSKNLFTL